MRKTLFILLLLGMLTPSTHAQEETPITLRVWWPDSLFSEESAITLETEFENFTNAYVSTELDIRYREYQTGESFHRLDLTADVAPDALPDITLMRRQDLITAANADLIQPLDGWVPATTLSEVPSNILAMGQVDGRLYGLPYLVDVLHMIHVAEENTSIPDDYREFLAQETPLLFAGSASVTSSVNELVLLQYLAAGGSLSDSEGNSSLDETALATVLNFYSDLLDNNTFSETLLESLQYQSPTEYWSQIADGENIFALMNSSTYLNRQDQLGENARISAPLTPNGETFSLVDGWMWVLVTDNAARQAEARNFLSWMMISDKLAASADVLGMLPSQQSALRVMADDNDVNLLRDLLDIAVVLPIQLRRNSAAEALQMAFEAVLDGTPPDEAISATLQSLATNN